MKIGETVAKLREEKKMSQEEFAQYFHVTRQTISNWEKEKSFPDLQTLVKISDASGVSIDSMLRDNFNIVQHIDKKVRQLKMFKIGTAIIAAIVLIIGSYVGIQNIKQTSIIQTFESSLEKMGFEKTGNDYCLKDTDFSYHVYTFNRPTIWKLNQNMKDREKFVVGTYSQADSDWKENVRITIRKTREFTTLNISRGNYLENGISPQINEYIFDKNGHLNHIEKIDKDDYEIYEALQNEIKKAVKKMDEIYSELYV